MSRELSDFGVNERRVIAERRHGWEKAPVVMLAAVFGTSEPTIRTIARATCARCGGAICDHTDAEWQPA